jgi:hypothetical protein
MANKLDLNWNHIRDQKIRGIHNKLNNCRKRKN